MHRVHLPAVDMNLLVALDALLSERNVTRAAKRVGITQPAMSHALARLRALLADPLLVRTSGGMAPTPHAISIRPSLSRALAEIEDVLAPPAIFDPATARRTFSIAMSDYMELVLVPRLTARLAAAAPHVDLHVRSVPPELDGLAAGDFDLALRPRTTSATSGVRSERVYDEWFVCMMRKGHPLSRGKLTLARYCEAKHVLVSPYGQGRGIVDELLARRGHERRVAVVLRHFLAAPHVVAATDAIITIGREVARTFEKLLPIVVVPPPLAIPKIEIVQLWHERQAHDPALAWLRAEIRAAARSLGTRAS